MTIRILIVDDHSVIRTGLRTILKAQADLEVVGEAADGHEAIQLARELHPDVVLTDISMPGPAGGGIEVTRRLREMLPHITVLILTVHEDETLLREAIRVGASGYVIKRAAESELVNAIQAVARGEMYIHPAMTRALLKDLATPAEEIQITAYLREGIRFLTDPTNRYSHRPTSLATRRSAC